MIITEDNFEEALPLVKKSIDQAEFISFDMEFSGVHLNLETRITDYDSVEEAYQKKKECVDKFVAF